MALPPSRFRAINATLQQGPSFHLCALRCCAIEACDMAIVGTSGPALRPILRPQSLSSWPVVHPFGGRFSQCGYGLSTSCGYFFALE
jgi:hypothetical protein